METESEVSDFGALHQYWFYNTHGHKLRFPTQEKAHFVTALGINAFSNK